MEKDLIRIKDYIVSRIRTEDPDPQFLNELDHFLHRLIDETEGGLTKDAYMHKAGRQLLCSIGIDLKSGCVPASVYRQIFRATDRTNLHLQARLLFFKSLNENHFYYKDTERRLTDNYCLLVFPIKDRDYYIDGSVFGIHTLSSIEVIFDEMYDYTKTHTVPLLGPIMDKRSPISYYWMTVRDEIQVIESGSPTPCKDAVDRLGLSHFDFKTADTQYFCYADLGTTAIDTFKPNATVINWNGSTVGFLSYRQDESGRTFSISGYANHHSGIRERIFLTHVLTDTELKKTRVRVFPDRIDPPIVANLNELVEEGIKRFDLI